eukprot:10621982-Lingulodinium_polyedra.AAC.1
MATAHTLFGLVAPLGTSSRLGAQGGTARQMLRELAFAGRRTPLAAPLSPTMLASPRWLATNY